jgi:hypothetical protein
MLEAGSKIDLGIGYLNHRYAHGTTYGALKYMHVRRQSVSDYPYYLLGYFLA